MAELKQLKHFDGNAVVFSDSDWYDLNLLYCMAESESGNGYNSLNDVVRSAFELGIQLMKEELETQLTLKSLVNQ